MTGDMAAGSKVIFERSCFNETKSRHLKYIDGHNINHKVELILPNSDSLPEVVAESCPVLDQFFLVRGLPVLEFVKEEFVNKILKRGHFTALSVGTRVDSHNVVALLPTGHLILSVDKDTYQELGLQGRPSEYTGRKPTHFVIDINLFDVDHKSVPKQYERVVWSLTNRPGLDMNFLCTWEPVDDNQPAISQIASVLDRSKIEQLPLTSCTRCSGQATIPELTSQQPLDGDTVLEAYNRIGGLAYSPGDFHLRSSLPSIDVKDIVCASWTGMITTNRIHQMLSALRSLMKSSSNIPWAVLTVHGFDDSPVSWDQKEHGFDVNGCNLYTFVVFPNDDYWLFMGIGAKDLCP